MKHDLLDGLADIERELSGELSLSAIRLDRDDQIDYRPGTVVCSASVIKIPMLITLFSQAALGEISLDSIVPVPEEARIPQETHRVELGNGHTALAEGHVQAAPRVRGP